MRCEVHPSRARSENANARPSFGAPGLNPDRGGVVSLPGLAPPPTVPPAPFGGPTVGRAGHFRAHARRRVRFHVGLSGLRSGTERQAHVVDVSVAGAGVETDEPLVPGERISVTLSTPSLWDPLVLAAVVAWAHPPRAIDELDALGRPRVVARAGLAFDYPDPAAALAMFELLASLGYD